MPRLHPRLVKLLLAPLLLGGGVLAPPGPAAAAAPARLPVSWAMALPYPLRTLLHRWRGMLGMMIGVGIALSLAMTMFAVSKASIELYTADYLRSGADLYAITEGGTFIPLLPGDTPGTIKQARRVLGQIRGLPDVQAAVGVMSWSMERGRVGPRRGDQPAELILTMGVDGDPAAIPDLLLLEEGRWLRRSDEIVIGAKLGREKKLRLGDTLRLNGRDFTIVGVGKLRGFGFSTDSVAYLEMGVFRDRAGVGDLVNIIAIDTPRPEAVRARLPEVAALPVASPAELVRKAEEANASAVAIRWVFSLLALGIGALFVSNMLSRSVVERRLEFATLRAIGIPSRTILLVVALEAVLVSLAATVVGIFLSLGFGILINKSVAEAYGIESLYAADAQAFVLVLILALALGLGAGLLPARQATRVDPVDILREA